MRARRRSDKYQEDLAFKGPGGLWAKRENLEDFWVSGDTFTSKNTVCQHKIVSKFDQKNVLKSTNVLQHVPLDYNNSAKWPSLSTNIADSDNIMPVDEMNYLELHDYENSECDHCEWVSVLPRALYKTVLMKDTADTFDYDECTWMLVDENMFSDGEGGHVYICEDLMSDGTEAHGDTMFFEED